MTEYLKSSDLTASRATTVIVEAEGEEAIGEEEGTLIAALLLGKQEEADRKQMEIHKHKLIFLTST